MSDLLRETAELLIVPAFQGRRTAEEKAPGEWVTDVDREVEKALGSALNSMLPGSRVIGEEAVHADPSLLDGPDAGSAGGVRDPRVRERRHHS